MVEPKMTAQEFEASRPHFWRLTEDTIEMARLVLVEGHSQSDVARKYELTRQRVSLAVKQVLTAVEEIPNGWVKLEIWLPPAMASKVRDMAQKARQSSSGRRRSARRAGEQQDSENHAA